MRTLFLALGVLSTAACATTPSGSAPQVVEAVDLDRYLGTWYEISRLPNRFQKNCVGTTATYSRRPDGDIAVLNRCRKSSLDGKERSARGKAWVVDETTGAKLKVQFFWPFSGDYWVLQLDPEYRFAVVGSPDRRYLWVLSRTPSLDQETYAAILDRAAEQGFDTAALIVTEQG